MLWRNTEMATPFHHGQVHLPQSAHMMNSSVSISDVSPSPADISDKNTFELKKSSPEPVSSSPFHELMKEIMAQQGTLTQRAQLNPIGDMVPDPNTTEGERQNSAEADSGLLSPLLESNAEVLALATSPLMSPSNQSLASNPSLTTGLSNLSSADQTNPSVIQGLFSLEIGAQPLQNTTMAPESLVSLATEAAESPSAQWGEWKETRLSQSLTVITQPLSDLNEHNLNEFAIQQGLDTNTVRWLLGGQGHPTSVIQTSRATQALELKEGIIKPFWLDLTPMAGHSLVSLIKGNGNPESELKFAAVGLPIGSDTEMASTDNPGAGDTNQPGSSQTGLSGQVPAQSMRHNQETQAGKPPALPFNTTLLGQDLADKMSTAIGQRLLESIEKGEWQVKIHLKPVELGHIEVDLKMKNNALEAHFSASQSIARELLEQGLGRLKETLQQTGMDVASVRVNDGQLSRNGGDSTPRDPQQGHNGSPPKENLSKESESPAAYGNSTISDGRLDLMV